jgi:hypothetical protein
MIITCTYPFALYDTHEAAQTAANALNKHIVFDALSETAVALVNVTFAGQENEGEIENIFAVDRWQSDLEIPDIRLSIHRVDDVTTRMCETSLREAIEDLTYRCLEEEEKGWRIDDGSHGVFEFVVDTRKITLEFHQRQTSFREHEF